MNYGIIVIGFDDVMVGGYLGDFIEKFIFLGGELMYVSCVICIVLQVGFEMVDIENLCLYYVCMLWCWFDNLEVWLFEVEVVLQKFMFFECVVQVLWVFWLYFVGCVFVFEEGWILFYQILLICLDGLLDGQVQFLDLLGVGVDYLFCWDYIYYCCF